MELVHINSRWCKYRMLSGLCLLFVEKHGGSSMPGFLKIWDVPPLWWCRVERRCKEPSMDSLWLMTFVQWWFKVMTVLNRKRMAGPQNCDYCRFTDHATIICTFFANCLQKCQWSCTWHSRDVTPNDCTGFAQQWQLDCWNCHHKSAPSREGTLCSLVTWWWSSWSSH